ncbi:MAG: hypothetical protein AAB573_00560 [Patescibacteria group bacterium]
MAQHEQSRQFERSHQVANPALRDKLVMRFASQRQPFIVDIQEMTPEEINRRYALIKLDEKRKKRKN